MCQTMERLFDQKIAAMPKEVCVVSCLDNKELKKNSNSPTYRRLWSTPR